MQPVVAANLATDVTEILRGIKSIRNKTGYNMKPIMRNYQSDEDYWCIREFLRAVSICNDRHDFAWCLLRWDYWRWHGIENMLHFQLRDIVTLWEMDGQIAAVLTP